MAGTHEGTWAELLATLAPATAKPAECRHEVFASAVSMNRFEDTGLFLAEVSICCVQCHEPFRFKGAPAGVAWDAPTSSIDGLVLNAPVEPEIEKRLHDRARYVMPAIPVKH
jgi:hypothetical protein